MFRTPSPPSPFLPLLAIPRLALAASGPRPACSLLENTVRRAYYSTLPAPRSRPNHHRDLAHHGALVCKPPPRSLSPGSLCPIRSPRATAQHPISPLLSCPASCYQAPTTRAAKTRPKALVDASLESSLRPAAWPEKGASGRGHCTLWAAYQSRRSPPPRLESGPCSDNIGPKPIHINSSSCPGTASDCRADVASLPQPVRVLYTLQGYATADTLTCQVPLRSAQSPRSVRPSATRQVCHCAIASTYGSVHTLDSVAPDPARRHCLDTNQAHALSYPLLNLVSPLSLPFRTKTTAKISHPQVEIGIWMRDAGVDEPCRCSGQCYQ